MSTWSGEDPTSQIEARLKELHFQPRAIRTCEKVSDGQNCFGDQKQYVKGFNPHVLAMQNYAIAETKDFERKADARKAIERRDAEQAEVAATLQKQKEAYVCYLNKPYVVGAAGKKGEYQVRKQQRSDGVSEGVTWELNLLDKESAEARCRQEDAAGACVCRL